MTQVDTATNAWTVAAAIDEARRRLGPSARPSGLMRLTEANEWEDSRLQQEWRGEYGAVWLNVPVEQASTPPPEI